MSNTSKPAPPKQWAVDEAYRLAYSDADRVQIARALERAYQRGRDEGLEDAAETNLRCVWNEDDIPEKFFPDGYEDGWIDATEECARRIRGLKSERGAGSMPYGRVER